jgi:aromatic ring hydroxylase
MAARSGEAYVESLKKNAPSVFLDGRRVADVTAEPIFQEPIRTIAEQYDMQLDPAYREVMTYRPPKTGDPVSSSFLVPYTRQEPVKKRKHFKAGGFFYAPSEADLANPDVRPYIDKYVQGREGISAEERIALFKLAWDVTACFWWPIGSSLMRCRPRPSKRVASALRSRR